MIEEFELQDIENIRIVTDGSRHYEYQRMFDYEWNIDITTPQYSIFDKPLIDVSDTELDGFIEGMCEQFYNADYKLINKPRYAYDLACNYISFIFERRLKNLKKIIVNVGIRVSESPEVQKVEILFNRKICLNYCMALFYVREQLILFE